MQSWDKLIADENKILGKHFTPGRAGHKIEFVVLHHNAGTLSIQDCFNVWQTRQASAHYQVQVDGRIGQLVHDVDTAWHAGNLDANHRSIGIEHADATGAPGWSVSEATLDNGAHLVAAICRYYGLGAPRWGVNVFPHNHFTSTACPASLAGAQRDDYLARALAYYNGTTAPAPSHAPSSGIDTDGWWGSETTSLLQRVLGTPVDGVVSSQSAAQRPIIATATSGWDWQGAPRGSQVIAALQRVIGAGDDGILGPDSINHLEAHFGIGQDGRLDGPSQTVAKLQAALNAGRV